MMRRAFTLIEMLVVVAIIALLIAMLQPSVRGARLRALETVCASGLKQLGGVSLIYAGDNFGKLPPMQLSVGGTGSYTSNLYWSYPSWRKYLETNYNVGRKILNPPTNPSWDQDYLYYWGWDGKNPNTASNMVFGRFYFGSLGDTDGFYAGLRGANKPPSTARPVFPARVSDRSFSPLLWADLNRVIPSTPGKVDWSTAGDPRLGASHLYTGNVNEMPAGTHEANVDCSVQWVPGSAMQNRATYGGVDLYW